MKGVNNMFHKKQVVILRYFLLSALVSTLFISCSDQNDVQTYTINIVNATITVSAGTHDAYQVNISSSMSNPRITGSFTASGGSGNDIIVYVMDNTNYVNWANGHQANCYYNSGQVTTGSFNVNLTTAGTYYVVYDNSFSTISKKVVTTRADLYYTQ
jgi:hypothetical protein